MAASPKRKIIVKCLYEGKATWPVDVEFEIDRKGSLVGGAMETICNYLETIKFIPRWSVPDGGDHQHVAGSQSDQFLLDITAPMCPKHNTAMKLSKFKEIGGSRTAWYCPKKEGALFCSEKVTD